MKSASLVELMGIAEDLGRRTAEEAKQEQEKQAASAPVLPPDTQNIDSLMPFNRDGKTYLLPTTEVNALKKISAAYGSRGGHWEKGLFYSAGYVSPADYSVHIDGNHVIGVTMSGPFAPLEEMINFHQLRRLDLSKTMLDFAVSAPSSYVNLLQELKKRGVLVLGCDNLLERLGEGKDETAGKARIEAEKQAKPHILRNEVVDDEWKGYVLGGALIAGTFGLFLASWGIGKLFFDDNTPKPSQEIVRAVEKQEPVMAVLPKLGETVPTTANGGAGSGLEAKASAPAVPGSVVAKNAPETSVIEPSSVQKELFSMAELADCYRISGVKYRNDVYVVDVSKALLENGAKKTQDGWIVYSKNALKNNGFVVGSLPMYHAIFSELEEHKNSPAYSGAVTSLIDFLNKPIREPGYATLTRIEYNRSKKSWVIHNVGMPDAQTIIKEVDLGDKKDQGTARVYTSRFSTSTAGTRTWRSMTSEDCNTLFGSSNVSSVYSSLFNQDEFAWGFKLDSQVIAVVRLGSKQNSFDISDNNNAALPAWGLRFTKQSESKEAAR
jgi:hypothetical protein